MEKFSFFESDNNTVVMPANGLDDHFGAVLADEGVEPVDNMTVSQYIREKDDAIRQWLLAYAPAIARLHQADNEEGNLGVAALVGPDTVLVCKHACIGACAAEHAVTFANGQTLKMTGCIEDGVNDDPYEDYVLFRLEKPVEMMPVPLTCAQPLGYAFVVHYPLDSREPCVSVQAQITSNNSQYEAVHALKTLKHSSGALVANSSGGCTSIHAAALDGDYHMLRRGVLFSEIKERKHASVLASILPEAGRLRCDQPLHPNEVSASLRLHTASEMSWRSMPARAGETLQGGPTDWPSYLKHAREIFSTHGKNFEAVVHFRFIKGIKLPASSCGHDDSRNTTLAGTERGSGKKRDDHQKNQANVWKHWKDKINDNNDETAIAIYSQYKGEMQQRKTVDPMTPLHARREKNGNNKRHSPEEQQYFADTKLRKKNAKAVSKHEAYVEAEAQKQAGKENHKFFAQKSTNAAHALSANNSQVIKVARKKR